MGSSSFVGSHPGVTVRPDTWRMTGSDAKRPGMHSHAKRGNEKMHQHWDNKIKDQRGSMPKDNLSVFQDRKWLYSYKTSSMGPNGKPVDILHDFYIPALKHSVQYDRVAGYFRSSSLAEASQGFSAFTGAGGNMRMIVGTDLDPDDVAAILEGDEKRLADRLNHELEKIEAWPDDIRNGVVLLAWMVSRECLNVKVAFRLK